MRWKSLRLCTFQVPPKGPPLCFRINRIQRAFRGSFLFASARSGSSIDIFVAPTISRRRSSSPTAPADRIRRGAFAIIRHLPAGQGLHVPCPSDQPSSFLLGWQPSFRGELIDRLGQISAEPSEQFLARHPDCAMSELIWSAPNALAKSFGEIGLFDSVPTQESATSA